MISIRLASLAVCCAALAACAARPEPPSNAPPPPEPVDGLYRGTSTRFQADSKTCPRPGLIALAVLEGRFQYRWDYRTWVDGVLSPDGALQGSGPGIVLQGRRDGAKLEGDVSSDACGLHFTLYRKDN